MSALAGRCILITRPRGQNAGLAKLLEDRGALPVELPLFAIEPCGSPLAQAAVMDEARDADGWVFTSANAVHAAARLNPRSWPRTWAIGKATADALRALGQSPTEPFEGNYTSEALLAHPALQQANARFLLCTGRGGRTLIESSLRSRGATVERLDLYQRVAIPHTEAQVEEALTRVNAIVCTSGEGVERLQALTPANLMAHLHTRVLVVPSVRVVELARRRGFQAVHAAPRASDEDWVNTLALWL